MTKFLSLRIGTIAIFAIFSAAQLARAANAADIDVRVSGLHNTNGNVWICLWTESDAANFLNCDKRAPFSKLAAPASAPSVVFKNVQPGAYAISFFHDEKGNGTLDTNFIGIPRSAVGTSNNPALGFASRPTFGKSLFTIPETTRLTIEAKYVF
jgi:uncharacterized protein (DUF2141 family)